MTKGGFWKSDWFFGVAVVISVVLFNRLSDLVPNLARVAGALGYAHKQDIVHRDIDPAHIMYRPANGSPKVTDFGVARITDASKTKTCMV